jgi:hypothetical protein
MNPFVNPRRYLNGRRRQESYNPRIAGAKYFLQKVVIDLKLIGIIYDDLSFNIPLKK